MPPSCEAPREPTIYTVICIIIKYQCRPLWNQLPLPGYELWLPDPMTHELPMCHHSLIWPSTLDKKNEIVLPNRHFYEYHLSICQSIHVGSGEKRYKGCPKMSQHLMLQKCHIVGFRDVISIKSLVFLRTLTPLTSLTSLMSLTLTSQTSLSYQKRVLLHKSNKVSQRVTW